MQRFLILLVFFALVPALAGAQDSPARPAEAPCSAQDRPCLLNRIEVLATKITEDRWRDITYRELAKTLAFDGKTDQAVSLIEKIKNPDTRAMTIRGIGMTLAGRKTTLEEREKLYAQLEAAAKAIDHPASRAIAFTYISMAQAFAGDDSLALATAAAMDNESLRNKAFGEAAEIQAERADASAALATLEKIGNVSYRDKQYLVVLKIFANAAHDDEALQAALKIDNPVIQSEGIQFLLDARTPRDLEKETRRGLPVRANAPKGPAP